MMLEEERKLKVKRKASLALYSRPLAGKGFALSNAKASVSLRLHSRNHLRAWLERWAFLTQIHLNLLASWHIGGKWRLSAADTLTRPAWSKLENKRRQRALEAASMRTDGKHEAQTKQKKLHTIQLKSFRLKRNKILVFSPQCSNLKLRYSTLISSELQRQHIFLKHSDLQNNKNSRFCKKVNLHFCQMWLKYFFQYICVALLQK